MAKFVFHATVLYDDPDLFDSTDGTVGTATMLRRLADRLDEGGEGPFTVAADEGITVTADYDYA